MSWIINAAYLLLLAATAPWWIYSALFRGKYRHGLAEKFLGRVPDRDTTRPAIWCHAVSVGEVNLLAPLVAEFQSRHPEYEIIITTTTATGYEVACRRYGDHLVSYAPLDLSWAVARAFRRWRPSVIVLAELELWPNWVRIARREDVPVLVANGRLSDHSFRGYRRFRWALAPMFRSLAAVGAQSEQYGERFAALGVPRERVVVTGSLKFDGAQTDRSNRRTRELAEWAGLDDEDVVFLAGSTQEPEESLALAAFERLHPRFPRLRLILVPRHPERFDEVAGILERSKFAWSRRSRDVGGKTPVVLVDTMGELGAWWGTAELAYVGGTMGSREGQNMIEPAAYGAAVSFGPRTRNFRDVVALLTVADAAVVVRDLDELTAFVERGLSDVAWRRSLGERARRVVAGQLGAVDETVDLIERQIGIAAGRERAA